MGTTLSPAPRALFGMIAALIAAPLAWADVPPPCRDDNKEILQIDNPRALRIKKTEPNQTTVRAHIAGKLRKIYKDKSGHDHFSILIGSKETDGVEVVYSHDFGQIPDARLKQGSEVEACGDFIVSKKKTERYPASPDGAVIHWVHRNDGRRGSDHPDGYVLVDGVLYGFQPGRPKKERPKMQRRHSDLFVQASAY